MRESPRAGDSNEPYQQGEGEAEHRTAAHLLETVREYGQERLREAGETAEARCRHCDWFLQWAETAVAALHGPEQMRWLARLEQEQDNLRAALEWCAGSGVQVFRRSGVQDRTDPSDSSDLDRLNARTRKRVPAERLNALEIGLRLGAALWPFWRLRGYWAEGRERLQQLLALPHAGNSVARAQVLMGAGEFAHSCGDDETGRRRFEESLAMGRELIDPPTIAASLNGLGELAVFQHRYREARVLFEESLAIRRELGDRPGIVRSLYGLGYAAINQGELERARALFEEGLALARELGDPPRIAAALNSLGNVAGQQDDLQQARALCEDALAIRRAVGDMMGIAGSLVSLARWAAAARLLGAAAHAEACPPRLPDEQAGYEQLVRKVRTALGEAALAAAWIEGETMPLDRAIRAALREKEEDGP